MAQTTGAISARNVKIEGSANGSSWTDISGFANSISPDGGDRDTGEEYTFDGDVAILTYGKRKSLKLKIKVVYTEGASDPFETVRAAYEGNTAYYIRYSPSGQSTGTFLLTSAAGRVVTPPYPKVEAKAGDTVTLEFTFTCPSITKSLNA